MKVGYCIAYIESQRKIVLSKEVFELSEFIQRCNKKNILIDDPQNVYIVPLTQTKEYAQKLKDAIVKAAIIFKNGNDNPLVVSAARNTSLFGMHGPAVGDIGSDLGMTLMQFMTIAPQITKFPEMEELKKENECHNCQRNLPEPDGFPGVKKDEKLFCFSCYCKEKGW